MLLRSLLPALLLALPLLAQTRVFRADENHTVLGFKASTLLFDVPGRTSVVTCRGMGGAVCSLTADLGDPAEVA